MMDIIFRKYNDLNSSVFRLIGGNTEVKQTIALGYLMANSNDFLKKFLKLPPLKKLIGNTQLESFSKVIVHTEMIAESGNRADIVIQLYRNNEPFKAIIIEAKSIKVNLSPKHVLDQINRYLLVEHFPNLRGFELVGCVLTKNSIILNSNTVCSISWNDILSILASGKNLSKDYLNFLTNITGAMKFYEEEVYSIPAGDSYDKLINEPFIYECPNEGNNYTSSKKSLYVTFRKRGGGEMEKLFGIEQVIVFNPARDLEMFLSNTDTPADVRKRIQNYCDSSWRDGAYPDEEKQFFVLSLTNQIELSHKPKPRVNQAFRAYYKLADLLDPNNIEFNSPDE